MRLLLLGTLDVLPYTQHNTTPFPNFIPKTKTMKTTFMPQLAIPSGVFDTSFYTNAFDATEELRHNNDDGSCHVVMYNVDGAIFLIHEVTQWSGTILPDPERGGTVTIGLFVEDVQATVDKAISPGATLASAVKDYDYGYRQGSIIDPFGHRWEIQRKL